MTGHQAGRACSWLNLSNVFFFVFFFSLKKLSQLRGAEAATIRRALSQLRGAEPATKHWASYVSLSQQGSFELARRQWASKVALSFIIYIPMQSVQSQPYNILNLGQNNFFWGRHVPLSWSGNVKSNIRKAGGSSHSATNPFKTLLSTLRFMPRSRVPKIYERSWQNHEMGKLEPSFPANYTTDRNWKAGHNFPARLLFKIVLLTTQGVPWPPQVHAASELHRSLRKSFQVISDDVQVLWNDTSSDTTSLFQVILSEFQHVSCFVLSKTSSINSSCSKKPVPWSANFTDLSWSQMPCSWGCFYPPKRHQDSLRSIAFPHIPMKWLHISPEIPLI